MTRHRVKNSYKNSRHTYVKFHIKWSTNGHLKYIFYLFILELSKKWTKFSLTLCWVILVNTAFLKFFFLPITYFSISQTHNIEYYIVISCQQYYSLELTIWNKTIHVIYVMWIVLFINNKIFLLQYKCHSCAVQVVFQ